MLDDGIKISFRFQAGFNCARKAFKSAKRVQFLFAEIVLTQSRGASAPGADCLRAVERAPQKVNRFVVGFQRNGKRMAILAAMRERKARGIVETRRRAVNYFGDQCQRLKRSWSELFQQQQLSKVVQVAFVSN